MSQLKKAMKALKIYHECFDEISFLAGHLGKIRMGEAAYDRAMEVFVEADKARIIYKQLEGVRNAPHS